MFTVKTTLLPLLLLLLTLPALSGCDGVYDDGAYSDNGYYRGGGGHRGGNYNEDNAYNDHKKRVIRNCNMGWQNCMNVCQQMSGPKKMNECLFNCNNIREACIANN